MKRILQILSLLTILTSETAHAQRQWMSYNANVPTKEFEGRKFKLSALVRVEPKDTNAHTQVWARVDKPTGRGFFDNMANRPIRNTEWKTYTIEGIIDSVSTRPCFWGIS